jgi:hypothetical protein
MRCVRTFAGKAGSGMREQGLRMTTLPDAPDPTRWEGLYPDRSIPTGGAGAGVGAAVRRLATEHVLLSQQHRRGVPEENQFQIPGGEYQNFVHFEVVVPVAVLNRKARCQRRSYSLCQVSNACFQLSLFVLLQ